MKGLVRKIVVFVLTLAIFGFLIPKQSFTAHASASATSAPIVTQLVDGRVYYIKNQKSGLFLDVCGGRADVGTKLIQYGFHGEASQQFVIRQKAFGVYEILPYLDSHKMCIDITNEKNENNVGAIIYNNDSKANQQYNIVSTSNNDGAFVIKTKISNESRCLTVSGASNSSGANIIQYSYRNNGSNDNDHWYFIDAMVNQQSSYYIAAGDRVFHNFYISDPNKYYVVETLGNKDTKITLTLPDGQILNDDDSGESNNASIGFASSRIGYASVEISLYSDTDYGSITLSVRKQQAIFYSYFKETNDLLGNVYEASEYARDYYNTQVFLDEKNFKHARAKDERGIERIGSEIFVFSGHGFFDPDAKSYGFAMKFGGDNIENYYHLSTLEKMPNTKIALWDACYSANSNNSMNESFASKSVVNGAQCSVGFVDAVLISSLVSFTNNFFSYLYSGYTVQLAASYAANLLPVGDVGRNYKIFGDLNTKLVDSNVNIKKSSPILSTDDNTLLQKLENSNEYELVESENIKQYYKLVNGIKTTTYYTVTYSSSEPVSVAKSLNNDYDRSVREDIYPCIDLSDFVEMENIDNVSSNRYYHDFGDGYYAPIEIVNYNELSAENNNLYTVESKVLCKNLYTGEFFDYQVLLDYFSYRVN